MADNVTFQSSAPATPPAGTAVALDEVTDATLGTVKVQYVKLMAGALDSTEKIGGDAANGLDVDITRLPATTNAGATAKTADYDTGAGTDTVTMLGIALPASGGAVPGGTATNPVRTDPTGTTPQPVTGTFWQGTQPVSGPLTDVQLRATSVPVSGPLTDTQLRASAVPMTNQQSNTTADYDTGAGTQNVTMFGVALPAGGGAVAGGTAGNPLRTDPTGTTPQPVTGTFWQGTQPVSGTVTGNQGTAAALGSAWPTKVTDGTNTLPTMDAAARAGFVRVTDGTNTLPTGDTSGRAIFMQSADGSQASIGAQADTSATTDTGTFSLIALVKRLLTKFGTGASAVQTQGAAAAGAAVAGNPLLVAGKDSAGNAQSLAVATSTEAATSKVTTGMQEVILRVMTGAGTANPIIPPSGTGDGGSGSTVFGATPYVLNGLTYDRQRSNTDLSSLTSAARTATTATPDQINYNGSVAIAVLNITAASGTGGLQPRFQGKDSISGTYYNLAAAPTAIIATGIYIYVLGKGGGTVAGDVQQAVTQPLPRTWRVNVVAGDASSYTYSLSIVNAL